MARVGGRNAVMAWIAGVFCAAVIVILIWVAVPMGPVVLQYIGDTVRALLPGEVAPS